MFTRPRNVHRRAFVISAGLAAALFSAQAQAVVSYTTPNQINNPNPQTVVVGGTTFINQGLQGVGRIAASQLDALGDSFGSVSAMWITGWNKNVDGSYSGVFNTLPDRGTNTPDAGEFSDYDARIHTVDFSFTPYTGAANIGGTTVLEKKAAQNQIQATYTGSTLLLDSRGQTTTGLNPETAADVTTAQYGGKTLPFVVSQNLPTGTVDINKIAIDAEGLVLLPDGSGYISDEYAANIYRFDSNKVITGVILPSPALRPVDANGDANFDSTPDGTDLVTGRRNNQGMEGLGITPDGKHLFALMQSAAVQDSSGNQATRTNTRLAIYDISGNDTPDAPVAQYVLELPNFTLAGNGGAVNRTAAQSEIVVLSDTQFLVLSRDGNGLGVGTANPPMFKSILLVDLGGATDINGLYDNLGDAIAPGGVRLPSITPLTWGEAINMLNIADLEKFNINLDTANANELTIGEKWEGLSLVSALDPNNPNDYYLFVANDNDFITANGFMVQGDGNAYGYNSSVNGNENDTVFLAYRVTIEQPSAAVPEPVTSALAGMTLSALALAASRRRRA